MHPLETYLSAIHFNRGTGAATDETAHYTPLANLLNEVGEKLKPRVRCIMGLKDQGAGMPDGGLFTPEQVQRGTAEPVKGQVPNRGVVECKKVKQNVTVTTGTRQVSDYWDRYRKVLVTNYREFVFLGENQAGDAVVRDRFSLADTEKEFWKLTAAPRAAADKHGLRFNEFLQRVLQHAAPLAERKAVEEGAKRLNLSLEQALGCLGERTCDIYLNDHAFWRNVPLCVWQYTLGGYQVMKKWLSYRDMNLLARALHESELTEVKNMARRIAALLLLGPALDANYAAVKGDLYEWAKS